MLMLTNFGRYLWNVSVLIDTQARVVDFVSIDFVDSSTYRYEYEAGHCEACLIGSKRRPNQRA